MTFFSLYESTCAAWDSIKSHGFRSMLTTLGIVIGVASVIAVISMIQGLSHSIRSSFDGLGSNSLTIHSYTTFSDQMQGKVNRITLDDYRRLVQYITSVSDITPSFSPFGNFGATIHSSQRSSFSQVLAVSESYQDTYKIFPESGRFLSASDVTSRRKVCVIGRKLADDLKIHDGDIGTFIEINGEWFKIVGIMEAKGELFGVSQDNYALIPFTVGEAIAGTAGKEDLTISFNVNDMSGIDSTRDAVTALLRHSHQIRNGSDDDFKVETARQLTDSLGKIFDVFSLVVGGVVSVSLFVGGIGIMNIMLVSVTERTKEIGICKAIGATRAHILSQFILEALILSTFGALVGVAAGFAIGYGASRLIPGFPEAVVPLWSVLLSIGFCASIGLVFGILPAAKAANLRPVDALRYE